MEKKTPNFYRVRCSFCRYYRGVSPNLMTTHIGRADVFEVRANAANAAKACGGTVVAVRVKFVSPKKQHDFGWALRRMKEHREVRLGSWSEGTTIKGVFLDGVFSGIAGNLLVGETLSNEWELGD